jgi:hypothetical protein
MRWEAEREVGGTVHQEYLGRKRNFTGYHFWARGYCVSTVGLDEAGIMCHTVMRVPSMMASPPQTPSIFTICGFRCRMG